MPPLPYSFAELAGTQEPGLDLIALALAAEFREVDAGAALARLDELGAELTVAAARTDGEHESLAEVCGELLGTQHGFIGDGDHYDDPTNSMLDQVLVRRRGLPILLSVVYVEGARRAGVPLAGVGLPGHFVVGHFGADPPVLLDPFGGGGALTAPVSEDDVRPWGVHEIAMRMLHNLVLSYQRRGDI